MITANSFKVSAKFDEGREYNPTHFFVHENIFIGSVSVYNEGDHRSLWNLSIKEEFRGMGYGKLMMYDLMAHFGDKPLILYVEDHNERAKHIYQSVGFRTIGRASWTDADLMEWRREFV